MTGFRNLMTGAAGVDSGGYEVDNSVVLNDGDSQYLNKTFNTPSSASQFGYSFWVKLGSGYADGYIISADGSGNNDNLYFESDGKITIQEGGAARLTTTQVLRDFHAWYNVVVAYDLGNGTNNLKLRLYINGSEVTDFDTDDRSSLSGTSSRLNANGISHDIGANVNNGVSSHVNPFDGYLAEFVFLDGTVITPSDVGETDSNGVWRPIDVSGLTFGNNGFYLPFTNSAGLGQDYSGVTTVNVVQKNTYNAGSEINDGDAGANPSTGMLFTAPASGTVSKIELNASSRGFSGVTVRLETDGGSGTAPSGTIVTNGEVTGITSSGSGLKTATFSTPPEVVAGTKYWIVLRGDTGTWGWQHDVSGVGPALGLYQGNQGYYSGRGVGHYVYMAGNHFTAANSPTQSTDSPTGNRAVITPLATSASLSEGNLTVNTTTGAGQSGKGSIPCVVGDGNEYVFEAKLLAKSGSGNPFIGVADADSPTLPATSDYRSYASGSHWLSDGQLDGLNASHAYGSQEKASGFSSTFTTNDVIGVVVKNSGAVHFYKNGSQVFVSSDQTNISVLPAGNWFPSFGQATGGSQTSQWEFRFGDDMSHTYGSAVKLTTSALLEASAPAIQDGSAHHQTFPVWTGNAGTQTVTQTGNSGFEPDWAIIKSVSFGSGGNAFDSVRGGTSGSLDNKGLAIFDSGVEDDNDSGPAFGASAGKGTLAFTGSGNTGDINHTGRTYVGWTWLGGNGNTTPSGGDIPTTCSVNQTAGFSIVGWEGDNTNEQTIAHGLGKTPAWILYRKREGSQWFIQHAGMTGGVANGSSTRQLVWDSTDGQSTGPFSGGYIDTVGSSTVRLKEGTSSMNNCNASGDNYIAYMFADIPGYSSFSSYEGNGNTNGPVVSLGFKPAWLMIKNIDVNADTFVVFDNVNSPFNIVKKFLQPNLAYQQIDSSATGMAIDFLSNGFKVRGTEHNINESDKTHIYMAFAEHPFAGTTPATAR